MQAHYNLQTHHQASLPSEDGIVFCRKTILVQLTFFLGTKGGSKQNLITQKSLVQ